MSLISIIKSIQEASGSNAKKAILEANVNNQELKDYLKMVYEPTVSYYQTGLPYHETTGDSDSIHFLANTADILSSRTVTGFAATQFLTERLNEATPEAAQLLHYIITRDIKAGVAVGTISKVWPGLVTNVPYRRCVLPKDSKIKQWPWGQPGFFAYSQLKADGSYVNANVTVNGAVFQTRNGTVYPPSSSFVLLSAFANALYNTYGHNIQLQGELLVIHKGKIMPRKTGNGILNSIIQTGEDPGPEYQIIMVAWDCIPLEEAVAKGKGSKRYEETFELLNLNHAKVRLATGDTYQNSVRLVESKPVRTYEEAAVHFLALVAAGEEGSIIKHKDAVWMDGDDKMQVKGKVEFTVDLRIVGFNPGDVNGKHAKTFGSLQMETEDGLLEVGVSGMTDDLRKKLHESRDYYLGKIVAVTANDIMYSDNQKEKHSLFLPRITEIRLDKDKADTFLQVVDQMEAAKKGVSL